MDERQEVRSLKKGLRALAYINRVGDVTVTEVARALGMPRTTAHRILETLCVEGYLQRLPHTDSYRLTSQVIELAGGFRDEAWLREAAEPIVDALGSDVLWPIALTTPKVDQMLVRLATDFDTTLAIERYTPGYRTPIMHTTTGICYLANCDEHERNTLVRLIAESDDPRQALARNRPELDRQLALVAERGYHIIHHPEYREGSIGVPVRIDGRVAGGIVMRYIKSALRKDQLVADYVPKLQAAANAIARRREAGQERHCIDCLAVGKAAGSRDIRHARHVH